MSEISHVALVATHRSHQIAFSFEPKYACTTLPHFTWFSGRCNKSLVMLRHRTRKEARPDLKRSKWLRRCRQTASLAERPVTWTEATLFVSSLCSEADENSRQKENRRTPLERKHRYPLAHIFSFPAIQIESCKSLKLVRNLRGIIVQAIRVIDCLDALSACIISPRRLRPGLGPGPGVK